MSKPPQAHRDICAHKPCDCEVDEDRKYCSEPCAEAAKSGDDDVCPCDCEHSPPQSDKQV